MVTHGIEYFTCHNGHTWEATTTTVDNDYYHEPETTYDDGEDQVHTCPECGELDEKMAGERDEMVLGEKLKELLTSSRTLVDIAEDLVKWDVSELTAGFYGMTSNEYSQSYEAMTTLRDMFSSIAAIKSKRLKELVA